MPKMVKIAPNPDFKIGADTKDAYEAAKKKGAFEVPYITAIENVRRSGGMYKILAEKTPVAAPSGPWHEGKSNADLLAMLLSLGIKTEKQMTRSQIVSLIERKMETVEIVPEED